MFYHEEWFLEIGKVVNTHARGELKVVPWCDNPQTLLGLGMCILCKPFDIETPRNTKAVFCLS